MVIATISAGVLINRIGYYTPVMIVGICIMTVGAGLLTTLSHLLSFLFAFYLF